MGYGHNNCLGEDMFAMKRKTKRALIAGVAATLFAAGMRTWLYLGAFGKFPPSHLAKEIAFWLAIGIVVFIGLHRFQNKSSGW